MVRDMSRTRPRLASSLAVALACVLLLGGGGAALAQLPACLVFLGLTMLVFAFVPRATIPVGWTVVGVAAILGVWGPILQAPDWVIDLSPFHHSPVPAGGETDWTGGFWMLAIGLAAGAVAVWSMRRRELASGG